MTKEFVQLEEKLKSRGPQHIVVAMKSIGRPSCAVIECHVRGISGRGGGKYFI